MTSSYYTDDVNGTIIGEVTFPYEFWIDEPRREWVDRDGKRRVAKGSFSSDFEATEWFKAHYPEEYRHGVEMRVWDR